MYKRDYQKISSSFRELAIAFQKGDAPGLGTLAKSTNQAAHVFEDISKLFGDQPDLDALPFLDALTEYKGMLSEGLPEAFHVAKGAAGTIAEATKKAPDDVDIFRSRQRAINLTILAEKSYLCEQQEADFRQMFQQFIRAQIMFYTNVTRKLEEALSAFPQ